MKTHGGLKDEEANEAAWEAARGAANGAAKWGVFAGVVGVAGYAMSPIYRGLTIQFKVFIQMAGMTVGSMIEADKRIREFEAKVRIQKKIAKERAIWADYEREFETPEKPREVVKKDK